jgi:hypothetical protein
MENPNMIGRQVVNGKYLVSTIALAGYDTAPWLFDEHGGEFETMVFPCNEQGTVTDWLELDSRRYLTKHEAARGHIEMVRIFLAKSEATSQFVPVNGDVARLIELADELDKGENMDIGWVKYQGNLLRRAAKLLSQEQ